MPRNIFGVIQMAHEFIQMDRHEDRKGSVVAVLIWIGILDVFGLEVSPIAFGPLSDLNLRVEAGFAKLDLPSDFCVCVAEDSPTKGR